MLNTLIRVYQLDSNLTKGEGFDKGLNRDHWESNNDNDWTTTKEASLAYHSLTMITITIVMLVSIVNIPFVLGSS